MATVTIPALKKALLIGVAAGYVIILDACFGGFGYPSPSNSDANEVEETKQSVVIKIWDQPGPDDLSRPVVEKLFESFERAHPEIKVLHEIQPQGTNDREVFVTAMAGGTGPDAYSSAHFPIVGDWIAQGLALDLTPYWNEYTDKDKFIPSSMEAAIVDNKVYGIPNFVYVSGLLWNKKLFREAGLDPNKPPATWSEMVEYGKKLTQPQKNQYGLTLLGMEWADWWFEYYVWQAGGDLTALNRDKTVTLRFTEEPVIAAMQYYKDLKWKYKIVQKNVLQSYQDNINDLYQGRVAMTRGGSSDFGNYMSNGLDLNDLGFAPFPAGPSGTSPSQIGGDYWIINPNTSKEKQDAAWTYITFMMSRESQLEILKYQSENSIFPNLLSIRSDIDPMQYAVNVPHDLIDGITKAASDTRVEYYLKERLSPYVVKAIQTALVDENANPKSLLQAAQEAAQKEVINPYNASILGQR